MSNESNPGSGKRSLAVLFSGSPQGHGLLISGWRLQTLFITKVSFTTLVTSGRSGALSARGVRSNGSGAMYHQIQNPIIAQTAKIKRMSLSYARLVQVLPLVGSSEFVMPLLDYRAIFSQNESLWAHTWKGSCLRFVVSASQGQGPKLN